MDVVYLDFQKAFDKVPHQRSLLYVIYINDFEDDISSKVLTFADDKKAFGEVQNECGLTTLETERLREDPIEVFKIVSGYEDIWNMFFKRRRQ